MKIPLRRPKIAKIDGEAVERRISEAEIGQTVNITFRESIALRNHMAQKIGRAADCMPPIDGMSYEGRCVNVTH